MHERLLSACIIHSALRTVTWEGNVRENDPSAVLAFISVEVQLLVIGQRGFMHGSYGCSLSWGSRRASGSSSSS
jgi:hypothetical protein